LPCSLGGYGQPQDATFPTRPDIAYLREGEQRGSWGQHWAGTGQAVLPYSGEGEHSDHPSGERTSSSAEL